MDSYCEACGSVGYCTCEVPPCGPGSELRDIIPKFLKRKNCDCEDVATYMDRIGPQGCRKNWGKLVKHLASQAAKNPLGMVAPKKARELMAERWLQQAIERTEQKIASDES